LFQFGEGRNYTIFTKIGTKLRQKLKYRNKIENEKMTPDIIVTRGIVTATSHCHYHVHDVSLTCVKFLIFLKTFKNK